MSFFHDNALIGSGSQRGYQIERSLRFNSADSAYLSKTPTTPTNNLKWTFSCWVKRSALGANSALFDAYLNGVNFSTFYFTSTNELQFYNILGGVDTGVTTTGVYRDLSAWYHIVFVFDSANATAADRAIIYVNGTRPAQTNPYGAVTSSEGTYLNNSYAHSIGRMVDSGTYLNGYLTETYLIDGQALTPSSFGETDTITGVWKPKRYSGSGYGTNGFYLKFADNSGTTSTTLGKDSSGNGNNWTPSATFSVTPGAGNDSMIDTPTPYADGGNGRGNYPTWNPLNNPASATFADGNLQVTNGSSDYRGALSTFAIPTSGKWYWETQCTSTPSGSSIVNMGIAPLGVPLSGNQVGYTNSQSWYMGNATYWMSGGSSIGLSSTSDVFQVAFDAATRQLWLGRNNLWYWGNTTTNNTTGDPGAGTNPSFTLTAAEFYAWTFAYNNGCIANFGQRPFAYTPPSGFKALNTQNLPEPSIKKPSSYFNTLLYTGNGSARSITGLGFSPDFVWTKVRSSANDHKLYDAVRGATKVLESSNTGAEGTDTQGLTAFNSDGFSLGTASSSNANGSTYVAWCWDESATPGFDIVTYTGDGVSNRTVSHGLGVAPAMIIIKDRDTNSNANNWFVWHQSLSSGNNIQLEKTDPAYAVSSTGGGGIGTSPSSSTFTLLNGSSSNVNTNENGDRFVAYLWSEVAGFSKFGSYTGNGSTDGTFVFCGFRPALILMKRTDSAGESWSMWDNRRIGYNAAQYYLAANSASTEDSTAPGVNSNGGPDFLSNGFKMRSYNGSSNNSGGTYIFAAFAESPFKYSLAR